VNAVFLPWKLFESLDFLQSKDVFDKCAISMGTTASEIYQASQKNRVSGSDAIQEAFFLDRPISDHVRQPDYIPLVASELMTITMAKLPSLFHLVLVEDTHLHWR
jgi:hypothetical protein